MPLRYRYRMGVPLCLACFAGTWRKLEESRVLVLPRPHDQITGSALFV
jgi:hypothetical protein